MLFIMLQVLCLSKSRIVVMCGKHWHCILL